MRDGSDSDSDEEPPEDEYQVESHPPRKLVQLRRITKKKDTLPKTNKKPSKEKKTEKRSTKVHWTPDIENEESNIDVGWNKDGKIDSS
eukprot:4136191-Ditylum_brightwellii.AAC.1